MDSMATLNQLKARIESMIAEQGENAPVAYSLYQTGDVTCEADEMGVRPLTEDEIADVLASAMKWDASEEGITWDSIRESIRFVIG